METSSVHLLCELGGCDCRALGDVAVVKQAMLGAAAAAKVTVLNAYFHRFSPIGVSGLLCIGESHISLHTWPESAYAALDIYTCGDHAMPYAAVPVIAAALSAKTISVTEAKRGVHLGGHAFTCEISTREMPACQQTVP